MFLPEQERTLRPTGIHLFGLRYWSAALSADVGRSNRRLLVKYDPRDMALIFFFALRRLGSGLAYDKHAHYSFHLLLK
jgi:hypothetical protein